MLNSPLPSPLNKEAVIDDEINTEPDTFNEPVKLAPNWSTLNTVEPLAI